MKTGGGSGGEASTKPEAGTVQKCVKNEAAIGGSAVDAHERACMLICGTGYPALELEISVVWWLLWSPVNGAH